MDARWAGHCPAAFPNPLAPTSSAPFDPRTQPPALVRILPPGALPGGEGVWGTSARPPNGCPLGRTLPSCLPRFPIPPPYLPTNAPSFSTPNCDSKLALLLR